MFGEQRIYNQLMNYNLNNLPHNILLLGEEGCGRKTLINHLGKHLGVECILLEDVSLEILNELYLYPQPRIYYLNGDNLNIRQQNLLLKTIEEPSIKDYFIIYSTNKDNLLPTILNRCFLLEFDPYSIHYLSQFIPVKYIERKETAKICGTPGKLLKLTHLDYDSTYDLAIKIITKLKTASFTNTLTIKDKLNYKDNYDKLDITLLFDILLYEIPKEYQKTNYKYLLELYNLTLIFKNKLQNNIYNKEQLIFNYLIKSWNKVRE